jgi:hypothetical protein
VTHALSLPALPEAVAGQRRMAGTESALPFLPIRNASAMQQGVDRPDAASFCELTRIARFF